MGIRLGIYLVGDDAVRLVIKSSAVTEACWFSFSVIRRCDRGTDAMHIANTPVVSPESKKPKALTSGLNSLCVDNRSYGDDIRFT